MATRNRTILFKKYRDAIKSVKAPMNGFAPSQSQSSRFGEGPVIELSTTSFLNPNRKYAPLSTDDPGPSSGGAVTVGLPPSWVDVSEEITANIQRVRVKMTELAKAHGKALMPSFGDVKDDQRRIEYFTQEITDLLRNSEKKLHKLSASGPSEDSNLRKNVQRSLATDLQSLSVELRKKQSMYLKRLQQQKEGSDGIDLEMNVNGGHFKEEGDEFDDLELSEHQMAKMRQSEAFTVEREREIQQVVDSVNELAQIMKDLSVLVIDQGTIVDRIDHNIENVSVSVEEGLKELEKAERSQKKGGMVTCATVLVIMCLVMVILLIIKSILF